MKLAHHRNEIERQIIVALVEDALALGYLLGVNDGEETTLERSSDEAAIFAAMASTDEDRLLFWLPNSPEGAGRDGWVRLIYGNDCDVISDNTTDAECERFDDSALSWDFMKRAEELAERFRG